MNATDVFLFTLAFLVSGLLAGWIRRLSKQREALAGGPPDQSRYGALDRLGDQLTSAVLRIEALERRHEQLVQELGTRTGPPAGLGAGPRDGDRGGNPQPGSEGVRQRPQLPGVDPEPEVSEISETQWRTAMDRLGPAWGSGSRPGDPGRWALPAERRGTVDGQDPPPRPRAPRSGTPLDVLFPPREQLRTLPQHLESDPGGSARPTGARPTSADREGPGTDVHPF